MAFTTRFYFSDFKDVHEYDTHTPFLLPAMQAACSTRKKFQRLHYAREWPDVTFQQYWRRLMMPLDAWLRRARRAFSCFCSSLISLRSSTRQPHVTDTGRRHAYRSASHDGLAHYKEMPPSLHPSMTFRYAEPPHIESLHGPMHFLISRLRCQLEVLRYAPH